MTFWRNYYHLVWAIKNREHFITAELEKELYAYIVSKADEIGVIIYAINGSYDHTHIVAAIPPKLAVADAVKKLKGASSFFVNHVIKPERERFTWQRGYGCLSVGEKQRSIAIAYVKNQKKHHAEENTNAWLERYDELDEGPTDFGLSKKRKGIKEEQANYQAYSDPFPF
jgi:putative transposase